MWKFRIHIYLEKHNSDFLSHAHLAAAQSCLILCLISEPPQHNSPRQFRNTFSDGGSKPERNFSNESARPYRKRHFFRSKFRNSVGKVRGPETQVRAALQEKRMERGEKKSIEITEFARDGETTVTRSDGSDGTIHVTHLRMRRFFARLLHEGRCSGTTTIG